MRNLRNLLLGLLLLAVPAVAAPLDPTLQAQLLALYARYGDALKAGQLDAALALRSAESRAGMRRELETPAQRNEALEMARSMQPDSVQVVHASINKAGTKATLITVATKAIPANAKPASVASRSARTARAGVTLSFVHEGGAWKLDDQLFGPDPGIRPTCPDERNETIDAYDTDRRVNVGGPIARVEFKSDHTLVVIRVLDEIDCIFLPPRDKLAAHGLAPDKLVPYAIVSVEGLPHRTDKHKVLADNIKVTPEDE